MTWQKCGDGNGAAGDLAAARGAAHDLVADADGVMVCFCMKVREGVLRTAMAAGARDLAALAEHTRAGTGCGTCRSELLQLLAEIPPLVPPAPSPSQRPDL